MQWLQSKLSKSNIEGKYNFHLNINTEEVDSSTTINITAYTDKKQQAVVPCNYVWFIVKNGVPQQITDFRGSSFICETNYIGYHIQCHIISNDSHFSGKAIVTLGPVELDVTLKTDILGALSQGYSNLSVHLLENNYQQRQCNLHVYEDKIKIMHAFSDLSYSFDYSLMEPLFTHHPKQINRITIVFNEKYEHELKRFERKLFGKEDLSFTRSSIKNQSTSSQGPMKLELRFQTRAMRDSFLYTTKAFITRRQIKNTAVIRKIEKINFNDSEQFSAVHQVNELRKDLVRYDRAYKKLQADRRKMEDQRSISTLTYSRKEDFMTNSRREEPSPLAGKVQQLERQNQSLNNRIKNLVQEINQIKLSNNNNSQINFKKKRAPEENTISHLLDDLSRSEHIVHFDAENQFSIDRLQSEKRMLKMNLDQANQKISFLEKRGNQLPFGVITVEKVVMDRLVTQKDELKRVNQRMEKQLRQGKVAIQNLKNQSLKASRVSRMSLNDTVVQRQVEELKSKLHICERQLEEEAKDKQHYEEKCITLARKVNDLENELNMYKMNQDVFNRSQSLSEQMEDYNEEQIKMLKEHNGFLVAQNEKLAKACEKYMAQAKQAIKLRQQILQLRQKLTKAYTNPESSSFDL